MLSALHPWTVSLDYVYDTYLFDHCNTASEGYVDFFADGGDDSDPLLYHGNKYYKT